MIVVRFSKSASCVVPRCSRDNVWPPSPCHLGPFNRKKAQLKKSTTRKANLRSDREDDDRQAADTSQSGAQDAGSGRPRKDRCGSGDIQDTDVAPLETIQHLMAQSAALQQENRKLTSTSTHLSRAIT